MINKKDFFSKRLLSIEIFFNKNRSKVKYIQAFMLLLFLYLVITPLFSPIAKFKDTIFTNTTLLSQFLFWGVWYGFCLLSVIFLGRIWCGVLCPLGALTEWVGNVGLKKSIPKWMTWDGWLIIMFIIVTILGQTLDVRDDPAGLAILFSYIFLLAIIIGFIFGKNNSRPWCRYFCPIGKILGIVSRLGMIDFKPNKGALKIDDEKKYYIEGKLCPTSYNLPYKISTNNCIACGACAYGKEKAGLGIYLRAPGNETSNILKHIPSWSEVIFILISTGVAAGGFLWLILNQYQTYYNEVGTWFLDHNYMWIFEDAPRFIGSQTWNQSYNWLQIMMITAYMLGYALIVGAISAILIALAAFTLKTKQSSFKNNFMVLTYQNLPIAVLSIIIGLCGKFFQVMAHDFNMSITTTIVIKIILLTISVSWAIILTFKAIFTIDKKLILKACSFILILTNIGFITSIWWPAILDHKYMSKVEKIRQHVGSPIQIINENS